MDPDLRIGRTVVQLLLKAKLGCFSTNKPEIIVIGGGAAGIMAAWRAGSLGARVLLLEKTSRLGTKILISGGGKCNLAHDGDLEAVIKAFRPNEALFLRPACYRLPNREIIRMFTSKGLEVYTRPDNRVFPKYGTAKDVVAILRNYLEDVNVQIQCETRVDRLLHTDNSILGVEANGQAFECPHVIVSTGGSSYPGTGTTGDGWPWAKELGHTIIKVKPALAPIYLPFESATCLPTPEWSGIALRDIVLKARWQGKEIVRWRGDLLFTHKGISGPVALGISRVVADQPDSAEVTLEVDLAPDCAFEELSERLKKERLALFADSFVPKSLVNSLLECCGDPNSTNQKTRNRLVEAVKGWKLGSVRTVPLEKGECVAGGISLDEVDPKTMRSRKCSGLYLCGEILDIAGPVGGYNLQAAFATGFVAGESAVQDMKGHLR